MIYYSTAIKLYETEIDPRRNLFIEEIEQYLGECKSTQFLEFKRFTPSQTITVKLDYSDQSLALSNYLHMSFMFNYARVAYSSDAGVGYFWYYFVSSIELIADATISVTLSLDSINSFRNWTGAMTARTYVKRQLVNRWNADSGFADSPYLYTTEDITGDIIKASETYHYASPSYLIYDGLDGTPTLTCTTEIGIYAYNHCEILSDYMYQKQMSYTGGKAYELEFYATGSTHLTINYKRSTSDTMGTKSFTSSSPFYVGVSIGQGSSTTVAELWIREEGKSEPSWYVLDNSNPYIFEFIHIEASGEFLLFERAGTATRSGDVVKEVNTSQLGHIKTDSLGSINRSKSSLVKIVEIPYEPEVGDYGKFVVAKDTVYFEFDALDTQLEFSKTITFNNILDMANKSFVTGRVADNNTKAIAAPLDPKILSDNYSYYKFVYDSYSTVVALSNINASATNYKFTWHSSNNISSASIFEIKGYDSNGRGVAFKNVTEDYPFLITSDRNNEIPLYSSEWLNYLRNGYNFDKKTNAMSIASSVLSTLGSLVMGAATIATGGTSAAATIPAAVGMAGAAVSGWTSTASTINSQLAKETQLKNQAASVMSVNDLSLFKIYGYGCLKQEWWAPRSDYKQRLGDLFFYRGYAVNAQIEPDLHCRTSFDYIECIPSWSGDFIKRTPPQFISLLNDRLQEGVTIIHYYDSTWDIAQEKGNIEV